MRRMGLLGVPVLLTVLTHFGLPLPATDPLRSTLVLLPLMVAALVGIGQWARERGGRSTPETVVTGEWIALIVVVTFIVGRHRLGLGHDLVLSRCLMGALVLLLMHRLAWLVPALRPSLGNELPRRPPAAFFALPFVVYLSILPWCAGQRPPDGDAPHYLLLTHSLAYDFDTDLTNNYQQGDSLTFMDRRLEPQPGDPVGRYGELYSRHNVVLPLLLAPAYRLAGLLGALIVMAALTAATCWLTLALAHDYQKAHPGPAVFAWVALAFTVPFILFSYQVWVEIPAALLTLVALLQIHQLQGPKRAHRWNWWGLALSVALLPLIKIRFLLISVSLLAVAIWRSGRRARRGAILILLGLTLLTAGTLLFNTWIFENPLKYHDIDGLQTYGQPVAKYLRGVLGLFFDCAFGLFASAPVWCLLLPSLIVLLQQRQPIWIDTCLVFLPYLLVLAPRGEWFGAWSPPYRYGIVMLPLLAIWLVPLLAGPLRWGSRLLLASLATLTIALTTLWITVPGWTYNFAHGRSHLLDLLSSQVGADVARLFASSIRLRTATFVWPPVALAVTGALWWIGRRRPGHSAVLLGVATALLLPPMAVVTAERRPTHVVEFEDPWLEISDGRLHPDLWVVYRPQYRGAWILPAGTAVRIPVVAGGERFDLRLDLMLRPEKNPRVTLFVSDGEGRELATTEVTRAPDWFTVTFEDLPWTGNGDLVIGTRRPGKGSRRGSQAILDRAMLSWRE